MNAKKDLDTKKPELKKGVVAGGLFIVKALLEKSVGLISTLVLARILVPEDFGLIASATIFAGFVAILSQTGGEQYIMKVKELNEDILNTNWTINLILKTAISLIIVISASFVAEFFNDDRLIHILYFYAFMNILFAFGTPTGLILKREQRVLPVITNQLIGKVLAVAMSITIALVYETYWALLLGQFTSGLSRCIGSYFLHSFRPKFSLKNFQEQFSFSSWLIAQAVLGYGRTQLDSFLIASNFSQNQFGQYNIMKYFAFLPSSLILGPLSSPLVRQLSAIQETNKHFTLSYNTSGLIMLFISLLIAGTIYINANELVHILLGDNWLELSGLFSIFAMLLPAYTIFHHANRFFIIKGDTKLMFRYEVISFFGIYGILIAIGLEDLEFFTIARVLLENIFSSILLLFVLIKYTSLKNTLKIIILMVLIVLLWWVSISVTKDLAFSLNPFIKVATSSLLFSFIFCTLFLIFILLLKHSNQEMKSLWNYIDKSVKKIKYKLKTTSKNI